MKRIIFALLALLSFLIAAQGATITWTNAAGGSWQTAANWEPNVVPGAADIALITASGDYTVTLASNVTINNLTLGGASGTQTINLTGVTLNATTQGEVTAHGAIVLQGGGLQGNLTIETGGSLTFAGPSASAIYALALVNNGTVHWQSGNVQMGSTPTTLITNNGLWEISGDNVVYPAVGGPLPIFTNSGTVRKNGGAGATTFSNMQFVNTGSVDVQSSTITFNGVTMTLGGTFTASAGASLILQNGSFTENAATFSGPGSLRMTGGTLTLVNNTMAGLSLDGGSIVLKPSFQNGGAINDLTLTGATLTGTNEVSGTLTVVSGGVTDMLTVRAGASLVFSGPLAKTLYSLTLDNNGTVGWQNGSLLLGATPTSLITNSGLWEISGDNTIYQAIGGPAPLFNNSGAVRKTSGSGASTFANMQFINSGAVDVQSSAIVFNGASVTLGGTFSASAGASLLLQAGSFIENGATFAGAGSLRFISGTLTLVNNTMPGLSLDGGSIVLKSTFQNSGAISDLTLNGAILTGTNEVTGTLTLLSGGLTDMLTVRPGATLVFDGSTGKTLYSVILNNNGTVKWKNGSLLLGSTPTSYITNSSLWEITGDNTIYQAIGGPTPIFSNSGTVRKISGAGTTTFANMQFINSGAVEVQTGTLTFNGVSNMALSGSFTAAPGATLQLTGGSYIADGATFTGGGDLKMTSGVLTLTSDVLPGLALVGGTVNLSPTFQDNGSITNLTLNGSGLTGTNQVTGTLTVVNGSLTGQLIIAPSGTLVFSGSNGKTLYGLTLLNNGKVSWLDGALLLGATPTTVITNSALWEISGDDTIYQAVGGPTPLFVNNGAVRKIGATGTTTFANLQFVNDSLVDVQSGIINMNGVQMQLSGSFTTAAGASFQIASGNYTEAGAVFSGAGESKFNGGALTLVNNTMPGLQMNGGTLQLAPTFQAAGAITNLTLTGVVLTGTNEIAGTMTIASGGVNGMLAVRPAAELDFTTSAGKLLYALTLINQGTVSWSDGLLQLGSTPTTTITNIGLWQISGDNTMYQAVGGPTPTFINSGTFRKIAGAGTSTIANLHFENSGLVEAQTGTITFNGMSGMILGGAFTAASGASINLGTGSFIENGAVFNGPGVSSLSGGTLAFVTDALPGLSLAGGLIQIADTFQAAGAITNLTLNGAVLTGTNEIAGTLNLAAGAFNGVVTVRPGATLLFTSLAPKWFYETTLINNGTVKWQGGTLQLGGTPTTTINNNGVWEMSSDNVIYQTVGGPIPTIVNNGTFRKISGSGATIFSTLTFVNAGIVEAQSGTIRFPNNYTNQVGELRLSGGRIEAQGTLTMESGTLDGTGEFGQSLFTGGTISPGVNGPGKITFTSGLNLTSGATVAIDALTSTPGTGHDQLAVQGAVNLGGATLHLGPIAPLLVGAKLTIIDNDGADAVTGTFNGKPEGNLFQLGTQLFRVRYAGGTGNDVLVIRDDGGVRLTAINYLSDGTFQLSGLGTNNGDYTIFGTTDFTNWTELGTVSANGGGLFQFSDTNAASFRFRFYQSLGPGILIP